MPKPDATQPEPNTSISAIQAATQGSVSLIQSLSIGSKIGLGYAIALGIATLGTGLGMIVGHQVEQRAQTRQTTFAQTEELINTLQLAMFDVRTNEQRLLEMGRSPQTQEQNYTAAQMRIDRADILLSDFEQTLQAIEENPDLWGQGAGMAQYLLTQQEAATDYLEAQSQLLEAGLTSRAINLPDAWQAEVVEFTASPIVQDLSRFTTQLNELVQVAQQLEEEAEQELERAEELRRYIVLGSMGLSVALAIFFASYTSRAIARPITQVTQVARQVTEEANFDLQAPITTADEVGVLAYSLNKLIRRVKTLLVSQQHAAAEQQRLQKEQLLQAEKMSSLGRMLAGVAHEINNPVNFIYGNLGHAKQYIDDLLHLVNTYQREIPNPPTNVSQTIADIDLEFLIEDLPQLLASVELGADRTRQIVMSLKNVSRMDAETPHPVDLDVCINSALLILNNRIKHDIEVVQDYSAIPAIEGYSGLLYQVFMNLISNALDALDDEKAKRPPESDWHPTLTLNLARWGTEQVQIRVADNGCGISPANQERIFDAFYTSKPVGVGTGLGLSITREIIEDRHHGTIKCQSTIGQGTEFIITLPIHHPALVKQKDLRP